MQRIVLLIIEIVLATGGYAGSIIKRFRESKKIAYFSVFFMILTVISVSLRSCSEFHEKQDQKARSDSLENELRRVQTLLKERTDSISILGKSCNTKIDSLKDRLNIFDPILGILHSNYQGIRDSDAIKLLVTEFEKLSRKIDRMNPRLVKFAEYRGFDSSGVFHITLKFRIEPSSDVTNAWVRIVSDRSVDTAVAINSCGLALGEPYYHQNRKSNEIIIGRKNMNGTCILGVDICNRLSFQLVAIEPNIVP